MKIEFEVQSVSFKFWHLSLKLIFEVWDWIVSCPLDHCMSTRTLHEHPINVQTSEHCLNIRTLLKHPNFASTPEHCINTQTLHQHPNTESTPEDCINNWHETQHTIACKTCLRQTDRQTGYKVDKWQKFDRINRLNKTNQSL